jgi:hypothetical protein
MAAPLGGYPHLSTVLALVAAALTAAATVGVPVAWWQVLVAAGVRVPAGEDQAAAGLEDAQGLAGGSDAVGGVLQGVQRQGPVHALAGEGEAGEVGHGESRVGCEGCGPVAGLGDDDRGEVDADQGRVCAGGEPQAGTAAAAAQIGQDLPGA